MTYSFPVHTFVDPDVGASLSLSAALASGSALPSWLTFNGTTRTLSGTPTAGSAGFYDIRITASDGLGGVVSDVFMLSITASGTATFYRGINLNGTATTIDGNSWQSSISNANFTHTNTAVFENQAVTLVPTTDANRASMIRSSIYGNFPTLIASSVANGLYDIYIYVWEDNNSETFNIAIEGTNVVTNYVSGATGAWAKLGPFRTMIGDGTINITSSGGTVNFSGIEIKSVSTTTVAVTGITASPSSLNVTLGKSAQVGRTIAPTNATNRSVSWSSSNTAVATVNNDGWVTGISPGTATITASLAGFSSVCNVTVATTPSSYSARLAGTTNEKYGLAKSLSVMPGDIITAEVFAKYVDTNTNNWNAVLSNLMFTIASGTAPSGTFIDGGAPGSIGGGNFPFAGLISRTGDSGTGPKAYLNYLFFDKNYVLKNAGFKRLSATPKENGTDVLHERLAFDGTDQITIKEAGFVYIYISNENDTPIDVYFDDFKVTQSKGPIVSSQEYYPFGLTFSSYAREGSVPNLYQFNDKEKQDELDLGWLDYGARMYDPVIGRWMAIDPMSERSRRWTPYRYGFNNPLRFIDPDGMTEKERKTAVETARDKIGTPYGTGAGQLDCSALVETGTSSAGISLKNGAGVDGWNNGVALIAGNSRKIGKSEAREGDLLTFRSGRREHKGKNGEFDHIGIVSKVTYDKNGKIIGYTIIHASSKGTVEKEFTLEKGLAGYELKDAYQWDTPEDNAGGEPESKEPHKYTWEDVQKKLKQYREEQKRDKERARSIWDVLSEKLEKQLKRQFKEMLKL